MGHSQTQCNRKRRGQARQAKAIAQLIEEDGRCRDIYVMPSNWADFPYTKIYCKAYQSCDYHSDLSYSLGGFTVL
jgi:hypothetical protein